LICITIKSDPQKNVLEKVLLSRRNNIRDKNNIRLVKQKEFVLGESQVEFERHAVDCCFALNLPAMNEPAKRNCTLNSLQCF
jgi:hypothetical protein